MSSAMDQSRVTGQQELTGRIKETEELIGVGVIVVRDGKVLLGRRRGAHGAGTWGFPGGRPSSGERVEQCALRELLEETGLTGSSVRVVAETVDEFSEGVHFRTVFVRVSADDEAVVREPDRCEQWCWFSWDDLPQPLFLPVENLQKAGYCP
jgi:8-oxo-dGTP diphosphatase